MRLIKLAIVAIFCMPIVFSQNVDLNSENDLKIDEGNMIVKEMNKNPITHAFIDGFDDVGLIVDNNRYVFEIENNNITDISLDYDTEVDYTLNISVSEVLDNPELVNQNYMPFIKEVVFKKDIPVKVKFRVLKTSLNYLGI